MSFTFSQSVAYFSLYDSAFRKADIFNFDEISLINFLFHNHKIIHLKQGKLGLFGSSMVKNPSFQFRE